MLLSNTSKMLNQLSSLLPDDRPITAIAVVEDVDKCPPNFTVVSRTYDQDSDADLWRESGLFIKKKGRYLCLSKTEGIANSVIEDIVIMNERDPVPKGFSMVARTVDTVQKAWRKKQLCYKIRNKDSCTKAVTDIIICSRIKKAPTGFAYAGEINGVVVCYKTGVIESSNSSPHPHANLNMYQNVSPNPSNGVPHRVPPERPPKPKFSPKPPNGLYPRIGQVHTGKGENEDAGDRDYEVLSPSARIRPTRPAPQPPTSSVAGSTPLYATLPGSSDLDGVPFVLNPLLIKNSSSASIDLPTIKVLTQKELDKEYFYDFRAERTT